MQARPRTHRQLPSSGSTSFSSSASFREVSHRRAPALTNPKAGLSEYDCQSDARAARRIASPATNKSPRDFNPPRYPQTKHTEQRSILAFHWAGGKLIATVIHAPHHRGVHDPCLCFCFGASEETPTGPDLVCDGIHGHALFTALASDSLGLLHWPGCPNQIQAWSGRPTRRPSVLCQPAAPTPEGARL